MKVYLSTDKSDLSTKPGSKQASRTGFITQMCWHESNAQGGLLRRVRLLAPKYGYPAGVSPSIRKQRLGFAKDRHWTIHIHI
jgi:hypothetical protein